jgi:hypothetical protein
MALVGIFIFIYYLFFGCGVKIKEFKESSSNENLKL